MNNNSFILGKPDFIAGVGNVHPILVNDFDEFAECSTLLQIRKEHFIEDVRELNLLDLIVIGMRETDVIEKFERLFSLILRKEVKFLSNEQTYVFYADENSQIYSDNYDKVKEKIMSQNLIFEQKIYKTKLMQEWADKVLQARAKNAIKMEFEDMLSTVSVFTGKHYWDLANYTIYQLKSDFNRINKLKSYDTGILAAVNGSDRKIEHFSESLDLHKNPYDGVFVDDKKLKNLNNAMK